VLYCIIDGTRRNDAESDVERADIGVHHYSATAANTSFGYGLNFHFKAP